jgi:tetratricopeptide (TPR) repeat protein
MPGLAATLAHLTEAGAVAAIDALTRQEVFSPDERLRFVHPLVRSAVYEDLPPAHRAVAHRRAASLLRDRGAPASVLAAQLLPAEPAGRPWAVDALLSEASTARYRAAPEAARELAHRALAEPPPPERLCEVLEELGRAELALGDTDGFGHLEAAAAAGTERQRVLLAKRLANAAMLLGSPQRATKILAAAFDQIDSDQEPELASMLQAELITAALHHADTLEIGRAQLQAARSRVGASDALHPAVLATLACTEVGSGDRELGVSLASAALARYTPEPDSYSSTFGFAGTALRWAGCLEQARGAWDREIEDARSISAPLRLAWAASGRAQVLLRLGRVLAAEVDSRTAVELHEALLPNPISAALAIHAEVLLESDNRSEALVIFERVRVGRWSAGSVPPR